MQEKIEDCTSTTSQQKNEPRIRVRGRKSDGTRLRSEFEILNDKLRALHSPLVDLEPIHYEGKFLGRHRLYIGNISNNISKEDLENTFKAFGEVNDVYIQPNKNFAFIRMDYYQNAVRAKQQLNGSLLKDRRIYITFSPQASILVKHLSLSVTNELLHTTFSVFGEIEYCFIVTDKRGKSIGEGVVDFVKKNSAMSAKKYCTEQMFFITSSLKPVSVEEYVPPADEDGVPEELFRKTNAYYEDRQMGPRFAMRGSFEYEYAHRFKELWNSYNTKVEMLKSEQDSDEQKLEMDLMRARYDHETERLKNMIRQREIEKERFCQKFEDQNRQTLRVDTRGMEDGAKIEFKPPDNLFTQASQLNDMLESEEREIQEQWRMSEMPEYRSNYEIQSYQDHYFDKQGANNRRKVPEVIVHCQKRTRFN